MNYIIKSVVKKVFQQYLNLQNNLDFQFGVIKLPQGSLNHERINQKLQTFMLQIISSQYKNLSIAVPFTQIVSKPIKINIQNFNLVIKKIDKLGQKPSQKQSDQYFDIQLIESITKQQDKQQKPETKSDSQQKQNGGYIKNMVNRLLYNMQIHIQNVSLTYVEEGKNSIHFQVNGFHIKNSLVLLEAEIIKKIFNLQTLRITHLYGEFLVKDFNICLDYNNKKLSIIAILNKLQFELSKIPINKLQQIFKSKGKNTQQKSNMSEPISIIQYSQCEKRSMLPKEQVVQTNQQKKYPGKKALQINIYLKIVQLNIKTQILTLVAETLQLKYKQSQKNQQIRKINSQQIEVLFKSIAINNKQNEHILQLKYLPYSKEVKIFSEYEDNVLKSSLIKVSIINTLQHTSYDQDFKQKKTPSSSVKLATRHIKGQLYYLSIRLNIDKLQNIINQVVLVSRQIKICTAIFQKMMSSKKQNKRVQTQKNKEHKIQSVNNFFDFVIYRVMIIIEHRKLKFKIYGSINFQYGDINENIKAIQMQQELNKKQFQLAEENENENKKSRNSNSNKYSTTNKSRQNRKHKMKQSNNQICASYLGIIQLCCQLNYYLILDLYNLQTKFVSLPNGKRQIISVGTNLISQLSIQLIKNIKKQIPQIIREFLDQILSLNDVFQKQDSQKLISFKFQDKKLTTQQFCEQNQQKQGDILLFEVANKISSLIFLPYPKNQIYYNRLSKIKVFLKINQIDIKLGTLSNINKFIWILQGKVQHIEFSYKQDQIKFKSQISAFISSPHTLHRSPLSNQFILQAKYTFPTEQFIINLKNNISIYLEQKYLQILSKYFQAELQTQNNQQQAKYPHKEQKSISKISKDIYGDKQYFCVIYNLTSKSLKLIQQNENNLQNSLDSIELQNWDDNCSSVYVKQQSVIQIKPKSKKDIFFLNDDQFYLEIKQNQIKSLPISIQSLKYQTSEDKHYPFHYQLPLQFQSQLQDGKYSLYFLFDSQGKFQKIFFKYSTLVVSYKNQFYINLQNRSIQTSSIQSLQILKFQNWIQFYKNVQINSFDVEKQQSVNEPLKLKNKHRRQSQYQILLDLDQQTNKFQVFMDKRQKQILKIKNLMKSESNYSLYGFYKQIQNQHIKSKIFQCYMYQKKYLKSTYFIIMPFLIIKNNLECGIEIQLVNKKTQQKTTYLLIQGQTLQMKSELFDFYNKQFTLKIQLISKSKQIQQKSLKKYQIEKQLKNKEQLEQQKQMIQNQRYKNIYESQQHYFNTFFMVQHHFQTCIQLRSNLKHKYDRKNILLKQQLVLKTKVLIIQNPLTIVNKTSFNFGFKIKQNSHNFGQLSQKNINNTYILSDKQLQNQYFYIPKHTQFKYMLQLKQKDSIQILFQNCSQNKIQTKYNDYFNGQTVLSFNFIKINDCFCHLLFRGHIKNTPNGQIFTIQDYISFTNISNAVVSYYGCNILQNQTCFFPLPPTANNKFNNKILNISYSQLQTVFKQLFHEQKQRISQKQFKIKIGNVQINFQKLLKITLKQINLHNQIHVFSLLKDFKKGINFYISDKIFNPNINYMLFNNLTKNNFLLSDDTEYTHHFKFSGDINQQKQKKRQKILINKYSFNILLNKENHQILLCDQYAKHLQKTSKYILKRQKIKVQCYNIDKFNIIDASIDDDMPASQQKTKTNAQIFTKGIQINVKVYDKLSISASIKSLSVRFLQQNKLDCLIQDIMLKDNLFNEHIVRIPEETFILFQAKTFNQNFILMKNVFLKCKNIIVNVNKRLPYAVISLLKHINKNDSSNQKQEEKQQGNQSLSKIYNYLNQKLLLIKNLCVHEIHLSISLDLQNLNFSNVVILPQFQIKNKFLRQKNLINQLNQFYMTNLMGKLPKLSFIAQNIRSPVNMIKTLMKVGCALNDKILDKPLLSFDHSQIPQNQKLFSTQRWNIIRKGVLVSDEHMIVQMAKNKTYYIISNLNVIIISLKRTQTQLSKVRANNTKLSQVQQQHLVQQANQQQNNKIHMANGVYIQKISLKELQSLKIIKNKKNSEIVLKFKKNQTISLCDQHKKCLNIVNVINRLVV